MRFGHAPKNSIRIYTKHRGQYRRFSGSCCVCVCLGRFLTPQRRKSWKAREREREARPPPWSRCSATRERLRLINVPDARGLRRGTNRLEPQTQCLVMVTDARDSRARAKTRRDRLTARGTFVMLYVYPWLARHAHSARFDFNDFGRGERAV